MLENKGEKHMLKFAVVYVRYALTTLSAVGFYGGCN